MLLYKEKACYTHLVNSHARKIISLANQKFSRYKIWKETGISKGKIRRCLEMAMNTITKINKSQPWKGPHIKVRYSFDDYMMVKEQIKLDKASKNADEAIKVYRVFIDFCRSLFNKRICRANVKRSAMEYIKEFKKEYPDMPCPGKSWVYEMAKSIHYEFDQKWLPNPKKQKDSIKSKHERLKPEKYRPIEERPPKHELRSKPGNFEIDSVIGKREDTQGMLTMIDIHTGDFYTRFYDRTMQGFRNAFRYLVRKYKIKIQTLTMDNGGENNLLHEVISRKKMFNCHPYSSGEKGTLENKHRLVRRIIPKSTSLDNYTNDDLEEVSNFVNSYYSKTFNKL